MLPANAPGLHDCRDNPAKLCKKFRRQRAPAPSHRIPVAKSLNFFFDKSLVYTVGSQGYSDSRWPNGPRVPVVKDRSIM